MKVKTLLIGMLLLAGAANAFAGTNAEAKQAKDLSKTEKTKVPESKAEQNSCTVTVSYKKTTITITYTCDCTQVQACDAAYRFATIGIR